MAIPNSTDAQTGWICPVCGKGVAPWLSNCPCTPTYYYSGWQPLQQGWWQCPNCLKYVLYGTTHVCYTYTTHGTTDEEE